MKSFCMFTFGWMVLLTASPCGSAESPFVESLAKKRWGDAVKETEWATSVYVSKCFPGAEVYHVRLVNRMAGRTGPPTRLATIVLRGRDATFLEGDSDTAAYFSKSKLKVKDARDATIVARAFADLRGYKLMRAPPGGVGKPPATDWRVTAENTRAGWSVSYTLLINPHLGLCIRYEVTVSRDGKVLANSGKRVHGSMYE